MKLDKQEIEHIASLARIGLSKKEIENNQGDLSSILDYFEKLKKVKTDKVEEIRHITGVTNVYRDDKVVKCEESERQQILKNAPEISDNQFKVKSVL